jgi:hypothetical protein
VKKSKIGKALSLIAQKYARILQCCDLARIQVKRYYKRYLKSRNRGYHCRTYYLYLPRRVAEPFLGKDLKITVDSSSIRIRPLAIDKTPDSL